MARKYHLKESKQPKTAPITQGQTELEQILREREIRQEF
jgi:hypothetical protein